MTGKHPYTEEDVIRWEECDSEELALSIADLNSFRTAETENYAGALLGFSILLESMALTSVAKKDYGLALGCCRARGRAETTLYRFYHEAGPFRRDYISPGSFQVLLHILCSGDFELAKTFTRLYLPTLDELVTRHSTVTVSTPGAPEPEIIHQTHTAMRGPADSRYFGHILCALVGGNDEAAVLVLDQKHPSIDRRFAGYFECLEAIAHGQKPKFVDAIQNAARLWSKYVRRVERGLPYSVCFFHGLGLIRLAQVRLGVFDIGKVPGIPSEFLQWPVPVEPDISLQEIGSSELP